MRLTEFQTVQIKALLREDSSYDPFGINERAPRVGDTGIVVDVRAQSDVPPEYTVECGRPDGTSAWIADFVEEELEAMEAEASGADTGTESEHLPSRPVRHHDSGATADESVQSDWRESAAVWAAFLSSFALLVAVASGLFFVLFFVWPPGSAAGAGFRAATVGIVFVAGGSLWTKEPIGDALITAVIVGVTFFLTGAAGWFAWTAA